MSQPPLETFQIGWICALSIEAAAAMEMLDEDFGLLESQDISDPNAYTLGRIGQHNIVIACLPAGQYGTTSATTVAINMLRTFSGSLRIGLMVGIGGGFPSATHDIRLGDIVISCPEGTSGGVLQYGKGKVFGGEFERTGSLNSPPKSLLTAVSLMRAADLRNDPCFPQYISSVIGRNKKTQKSFGRPSAECDRLLKLENNHAEKEGSCDQYPEVARAKRDNDDPQPHYGIIASGNLVIKDGRVRDQLRQETGALCVEMEAAGLMVDFPCIIIRGICDYADEHKNDKWQGYSSLAAAAYTKELLGYIPKGRISQEHLAVNMCAGLMEEMKAIHNVLNKAYDQQERQYLEERAIAWTNEQELCHRVFKISNYEEQKDVNPSPVPGTCQWALQNPKYLSWRDGHTHDLLWISADPGCGKSVLAKSLIDNDFNKSTKFSTCYFFFRDNEEQNSLSTALCAILHQLLCQQPKLIRHAMLSWRQIGDKLPCEIDELWRILIAAASDSTTQKTIFVFDALDECHADHQDRLIKKLHDFYRNRHKLGKGTNIKFLVTSRPSSHIEFEFQNIKRSFPHINLQGETKNDDIRKEIDHVIKLKVQELAQALRLSPQIEQRLEQQLLGMKNRTYLWLHLVIDDIRERFQDSLQPAEVLIQTIPKSVAAAYEKILSSVSSHNIPTVRKIFYIIVGAYRPLTIQEMAIGLGLALSPSCKSIKDSQLDATGLESKIGRLCGLFVFIQNSRIHLIHQTAKEFLTSFDVSSNFRSIYSFHLSDAHSQLSQICLRYLLTVDHRIYHDFDTHRFLSYSTEHWANHVRNMSPCENGELDEMLDRLYDTSTQRFAFWFPIFWKSVMTTHPRLGFHKIHLAAFNGHRHVLRRLIPLNKNDIEKTDESGSTGLIWASRNGHVDVVELLLDEGSEVNARGGTFGNSLYAASSKGHEKIVRILLDHGADSNALCTGYSNVRQTAFWPGLKGTLKILSEGGLHVSSRMGEDIRRVQLPGREKSHALYAASSKGHSNIVEMLLKKGANFNARGGLCGSALHAACAEGHNEVVQMLLNWGGDCHFDDEIFGSPLYVAAQKGCHRIVKQLIDKGADVNAPGRDYANALLAAAAGGNEKVMCILLKHGAHFKSGGDGYLHPLPAACAVGHKRIVQALLNANADVNSRDKYNGHTLRAASKNGQIKIVEALIDHGVDVNAQSEEYDTALQAACSEGHDEIVELLLQCGADPNDQCEQHINTIHTACYEGQHKIVELLLQYGADVNAQGGEYDTALQAACSRGHNEIIELLLQNGADINAQGGEYDTALQAACSRGYNEIVELLLQYGADVNTQGGEYDTALQAACSQGHDVTVALLLQNGANVNVQGGRHGNALQAACERYRYGIVVLVLQYGANVNAQGGEYDTALQAACSKGYDEIVELLLQNGADINAQGEKYDTALHVACSRGNDAIVALLLQNGANVNAQGGAYDTALQAACSRGHNSIVALLLQNGANVNVQGGRHGNALQAACSRTEYGLFMDPSKYHKEIVVLLLQYGADVNAQGGAYDTALQAACSQGHDVIVALLLQNGANVNVQGGRHGNALQAARSGGHDGIVELLLQYGADANIQSGEYGETIQIARLGGNERPMQLLEEPHLADRSTSYPSPFQRRLIQQLSTSYRSPFKRRKFR